MRLAGWQGHRELLLTPNFAHLRPEQIGNFSAPYAILLLVFATIAAVILVRAVGPRVAMVVDFSCFALFSGGRTFRPKSTALDRALCGHCRPARGVADGTFAGACTH
ncbi:hypothetical protein CPY51_28405 [Rhizobium tubonense]|uniref:Uncharacterized protein n=1 Tax=Rhizobium tubonense TaxID=484088 RepID=A0A2W4CCK6_9HYPH|nr:hypothetical protein CPY51_28405 [Rhizobium tubonense]